MVTINTLKQKLNNKINPLLVLFLGIVISVISQFTVGSVVPFPESANYNLFASDLFSTLVDKRSSENVVFSPVSIQTSLALAYAGARDKTAEELRKVLHLGEGDKTSITKNFGEFLKSLINAKVNEELVEPQFIIANRVYAAKQHEINEEYRKIAQQNFNADALNIDMSDKILLRKEINNFIAQKTDNKISEFVKADDVQGLAAMALVNAIFYKAQWLYPFNKESTKDLKFFMSANQEKDIPFMLKTSKFNYTNLPELQAQALELPYENSDISMLIILPNELQGLEKLEAKLKNLDLNEISAKMSLQHLHVYLPKFRLEYGLNLRPSLEKVITHIFLNIFKLLLINFSLFTL